MLGGSEFITDQWSAAICAAALGMQNAAVRSIAGVPINTVFITGNLVRLGTAVPEASAPQQQATLAVLTIAWIAYAAGAVAGALALHLIDISHDRAGCAGACSGGGRDVGRPSRARLTCAKM